MAISPLQDAGIHVAEFDLTGDSNSLSMPYGAQAKPDTVYGDDTESHRGGLKTVSAVAAGFWNADATTGDPDSGVFADVGGAGLVVTLSPTRTAGDVAYLFRTLSAEYAIGDQVGEILPYSLSLEGSGDLVRGTLMIDATAITATGAGSAFQVGALSASQTMYAALHVHAASGTTPTLDVIVESDTEEAFGDTPETQISFTQATAATSEWDSVAGAVTDDWWRVSYTIGGSSPSFDFTVSIGIL